MYGLELKDISVNYFGESDSIHSFSYVFNSGLNILYGRKGSGKTTLLKAIAGLVPLREGDIYLEGAKITDKPIKERDMIMVFDDLALRNRKSARYNLELPLRLRKVNTEIIKQKVLMLSKEFKLSESVLDTPIFRLSEEYRARVALARAFVRDSKVLIFDNPLSNLSPDLREQLFLLLLNKIKKINAVTIIATDSSKEVELSLAQTAILDYGYLVEKGTAQDFYQSPQCLNTAEKFVKLSSSFDITLDKEGSFSLFDTTFGLDKHKLIGQNYLESDVILVVPPYAITHGAKVKGQISNIFLYQDTHIAVLQVADNTINAVVDKTSAIGDTMDFDIDTNKIFLFDQENERSILLNNGVS